MKKIYYIAAAFTFMSFTACGDGVDLPNPGVETDLNKIPLPENELDLVQVELKDDAEPMVHPGFHAEKTLHVFVKNWKLERNLGFLLIKCWKKVALHRKIRKLGLLTG